MVAFAVVHKWGNVAAALGAFFDVAGSPFDGRIAAIYYYNILFGSSDFLSLSKTHVSIG